MKEISWDEFDKVELRVDPIIEVDDFPETKIPAYIITFDFGDKIRNRPFIGYFFWRIFLNPCNKNGG